MTAFRRTLLALHSLLILGMIVFDPHQAHRPPMQDGLPEAAPATATQI